MPYKPYKTNHPQTWRALAARKRKMADRYVQQAAAAILEADLLDAEYFAHIAKRDAKAKASV